MASISNDSKRTTERSLGSTLSPFLPNHHLRPDVRTPCRLARGSVLLYVSVCAEWAVGKTVIPHGRRGVRRVVLACLTGFVAILIFNSVSLNSNVFFPLRIVASSHRSVAFYGRGYGRVVPNLLFFATSNPRLHDSSSRALVTLRHGCASPLLWRSGIWKEPHNRVRMHNG